MTFAVAPVSAREDDVAEVMTALTAELAQGGYSEEETFGYSAEQLERAGVHLVGARDGDALVGIGGIELQGDGFAELKRMYVAPTHRGSGAADAIMQALLAHAAANAVASVRLETGDKQAAAMRYYARHGFAVIERFGPYLNSATSVCMQREL